MKRLLAVALFFLLSSPAHAALTVTTSTTQAGAPANVTINATFATTPSSVVLDLPPGLVGNPNAAAKCSQAAFEALGCLPQRAGRYRDGARLRARRRLQPRSRARASPHGSASRSSA